MTSHIIQGDARQTGLASGFFHCVVTSPPYFGLRKYGDDDREIGDEPTPDEYIIEMRTVGREVWRVLRDDGTWWLNLGDSFSTGGMSNPSAKSTLGGGKDRGAALYSITRKTDIPSKNLLMIPQRVALALQADGWIIRAQIPWIKANVMPESVRDRPTVAHEYVFLLAKSPRYFWDADAVRTAHVSDWLATRKPYDIKGNQSRNDAGQPPQTANPNGRNIRTSDFFHSGLDTLEEYLAHVREHGGLLVSDDDVPLAFLVNPVANKLAHFAMWPPRLVAPMIRASTSEKGCCPNCGAQWIRVVEKIGGPPNKRFANGLAGLDTHKTAHASGTVAGGALSALYRKHGYPTRQTIGFSPSCECDAGDPIPCRVLDPFAGSGTTMQVCEALGRDSWGVELMEKNIPIIKARLSEKLDLHTMKRAK